MKIPEKVRKLLETRQTKAFGTCSKDGIPNVCAIIPVKVVGETLWLKSTYFKKTLKNLKENPNVSITVWEEFESYQLKGIATYHTEGEIYGEGVKWVRTFNQTIPVKGIVEIKVKEIYNSTPGPEAGKKVIL